LTTGLLRYFETTGRYTSGINLFEKLRTQNIEVASLLAKVLFMGNEEVRGVRILHEALKETPMDYSMLDTQAEFLLKKALTAATPEQKEERLRLALGCADRSTIAAPSEFRTWARLAEVYVAMEDWEHALAVLNSCPMFTYQDKDAPIMPEPKDVYLPTLAATRLDEIDSEPESRFSEQVDPSLLNLRAASYKGTFRLAYNILTEMTAKLGWDQLLKIRSSVFVMEDEYRNEKQDQPRRGSTTAVAPNLRNPSTDGLRGSPRSSAESDESDENSGAADKAEEAGEAPKTNGDSSPEKPSNTIDPGVVKADGEKVSCPELSPAAGDVGKEKKKWKYLLTRPPNPSPTRPINPSPNSTTNASANAGSTASSWSSTKTSASTQSGARKWPNTAPSPCSTRNPPKSGRSSAPSPTASSTSTKPSRPTAPA